MNTFVSANAGSGKTTILTNRISRLLFHGVRPENILCATFTKAAAGEVQNRIFQNLSEWVMISDEALVAALEKIGEHISVDDKKGLARARRLFANALDTPGGLKVQTIHAFAARLLRIFPLEAGISPSFRELDEHDANAFLMQALQYTATQSPTLYMQFREEVDLSPQSFIDVVGKYRSEFAAPPTRVEIAATLNIDPSLNESAVIDGFVNTVSQALVEDFIECATPAQKKKWQNVFELIASRAPSQEVYDALWKASLKVDGTPSADMLKLVEKLSPSAAARAQEFLNRFEEARETCLKLRYINDAHLIGQFGHEVLRYYQELKARDGYLDYNDLIEKAAALLHQDDMMNWVMYRMDAQIEHVLIDEAQDTNMAQWAIVEALTENFYNDASRKRTVFVVGDEKQSIFSFQGADPRLLAEYKSRFSTRIEDTEFLFQERELLHSFRTAPPILALVDEVFAARTKSDETAPNHIPFKDEMAGRVEIWPFLAEANEAKPKREDWCQTPPEVKVAPQVVLAKHVAQYIHDLLASKTKLVGFDRQIAPEDFLILVRERSAFFDAVIPALRDLGVPVAGIDRIKLKEQLAVNDVLALLRFLAQPRDDLSLAATLRSPLFGLSEAEIFNLAYRKRAAFKARTQRQPTLFQVLKESEAYPQALKDIAFLQANTEYRRPYDLISLILDRLDGETKLRTYLGGVAKDALEGLLDAAKSYEATETPSLIGFLSWFDNQDIEMKRALAKPDKEVRIMTVHGAKGLEAPIVIAPIFPKKQDRPEVLTRLGGHVVRAKAGHYGQAIQALRDEETAEAAREKDRLLYVALTRAENHLIICGAGKDEEFTGDYAPIVEAFERCFDAYKTVDMSFGEAKVYESKTKDLPLKAETQSQIVETPAFVGEAKKTQEIQSVTSLLQALEQTEYQDLGEGFRGKEFGNAVHDLIAYGATGGFQNLAQVGESLNIDVELLPFAVKEAEGVVAKYGAHLRDAVFEKSFYTRLPNDALITGRFDGLLVDERNVTVFDFKTNGNARDYLGAPPETYIEQLAVYRFALTSLFPNHNIHAGLLWTSLPELQMIPDDALARGFDAVMARLNSQ